MPYHIKHNRRYIPPTAACSISILSCSAIKPMMANMTKPAKNDVPQLERVTTTESLYNTQQKLVTKNYM